MAIAFIALVWDYAQIFRRWITRRGNVVDANQLKVEKNEAAVADQTKTAATGDNRLSSPTYPKAISTKTDNST